MTTNISISYQVVDFLKKLGDTPFAARQVQDALGLGAEACHAVSGALSQLYKHEVVSREISQEHRGYTWRVIDHDKLNKYKARKAPSKGGDGARMQKLDALELPAPPTKPLHERLWELAIELTETPQDLSAVPIEALAAELNRRLAK